MTALNKSLYIWPQSCTTPTVLSSTLTVSPRCFWEKIASLHSQLTTVIAMSILRINMYIVCVVLLDSMKSPDTLECDIYLSVLLLQNPGLPSLCEDSLLCSNMILECVPVSMTHWY